MKKIILLALCLLVSIGIWAQSGTCGDNLTWTLNNGTLTISGTGAMKWSNSAPWYSYRAQIRNIVINEGVTTIAKGAFASCSQTSVTIPNSVTTIGESSFSGCKQLTSVVIPNSVNSIGAEAFNQCM